MLVCCVGTVKAEEVTIDGIKYDVVTKAKQATVISGGNYSGNFVIPSEITYNDVICSVTSIGNEAFRNCTRLTSIEIPNSVTSIGNNAFNGCSSLKEVHINEISAWCNISFGSSKANPLYYAHNLYLNDKLMTDFVVPESIAEIKDYAFWGCVSFTSIQISDGVTRIGCHSFRSCEAITSIEFPNSIEFIGEWAFVDCFKLEEIHISDLSSWCRIEFGSCNINPLYYAHKLYLNGKLLTELIIPNGVTEIKDRVFEGCSEFISLEIPDSVTRIGTAAFSGCSGLTTIEVPSNVTSIGDYAFSDCIGLINFVIRNNDARVGRCVIKGCISLSGITGS